MLQSVAKVIMSQNLKLTDILEEISTCAAAEKEIKVGEAVDRLEYCGYGPLLLAPPLLNILPTGFIPGVPTVVTILILFISFQIVLGKRAPWIPARIRNLSFSKKRFEEVRQRAVPMTMKIDRLIKPRLQRAIAVRTIACLCIVLALFIPFLEIVPFAGSIPSLAIVLFSLGISAQDGALVMGGAAFSLLTFGAGAYWLF